MSIIGSNILAGSSGQGGAYEIEQSLRFDGTSRLTRTPSSTSNTKTWTWSSWVKRSGFGANGMLWSAHEDLSTNADQVRFLNGDIEEKLCVFVSDAGEGALQTSALYRDPSAWMHVVIRYDTTQATAANRIRIYVNGSETSLSTNVYPSQDYAGSAWNRSGQVQAIGCNARLDNTDHFNGYISEVNFVDGTSLDPDNFGEYDENGVWRPIRYTGSYGTNGFYLKFDPTATNGIGHDHSGNGNNFTANNFTTSGTGTDVMFDTPTTNWATLNPLWNSIDATYAEGNLKFTGGSTHSPSASSISASSGKFYFEATALSGSQTKWSLGIIDTAIGYRKSSGNNYIPGLDPTTIYTDGDALSLYNNNIYKNGSSVVSGVFSGGAVAAGDVVQMAVDIDAGKIWFGIDGTWNNGGGTEGAFDSSGHDTTFAANDDYIFHFTAESCGWEVNFGQRAFAYTPPTGFKALNTSNLPAPDIAKGSKYFSTTLYTGVTGSQDVATGMATDLAWIKSRSTSQSHSLTDRVRGNDLVLQSNEASAETSGNIDLTSTGVTISDDNALRGASGVTYVLWSWLAGGSGSSNTDGSITSTVSANPSAGFSIVSYTGAGGTATVGHSLGVAPQMIIVKNRDASANWNVYHISMGNNTYINLNNANSSGTTANMWNNTSPTSTVFSLGTDNTTNTNKFVAYCFAEVEGYSKFGSYTGNNNNDGPFVFCGFKPSWLLVRGTNAAYWYIWDEQRSTYNAATKVLLPSDNTLEQDNTTRSIDFLSNGFKLRTNDTNINASGQKYIVAAFASNPFGGSGVSPATAR